MQETKSSLTITYKLPQESWTPDEYIKYTEHIIEETQKEQNPELLMMVFLLIQEGLKFAIEMNVGLFPHQDLMEVGKIRMNYETDHWLDVARNYLKKLEGYLLNITEPIKVDKIQMLQLKTPSENSCLE